MLSAGVDYALEGICIGEKRRVTLPARLGLASGIEYGKKSVWTNAFGVLG